MKKMTIEELNERIEKLEKTIFYLEMIDHWTSADGKKWEELHEELNTLKQLVVEEIVK